MKDVWENLQDITQISLTIAALCVAPELTIFINIGKIGLNIVNRVMKINSSLTKPKSLPDKIKAEEEKTFILAIKETSKCVDKKAYKTVSKVLKPILKTVSINSLSYNMDLFFQEHLSTEQLNQIQESLNEFLKAFDSCYESLFIQNSLLSNYYTKLDIGLISRKVAQLEEIVSTDNVEKENLIYDHSFDQIVPFMYRNNYKKRIVNSFDSKNYNPIIVVGEPGIGKTALCKELYRIKKRKNPNFVMLFVDLSGASSLAAMQLAVTLAFDKNAVVSKSLDELNNHILKINNKDFSIYFDNLEDLWNALNDTEKSLISAWIHNLSNNTIKILISSRVEIPQISLKVIKIGALEENEAKKIFLRIYGKEIYDKSEVDALDNVLSDIGGHTLSIILVAFNAREKFSLQELQSNWFDCKKILGNAKHTSLNIALKLSWEHISTSKTARLFWGMLNHWSGDFPNIFLQYIPTVKFATVDWQLGRNTLHYNHLLHYNVDKKEIHMLMAIKKQWPYLITDQNENYTCISLIFATLENIYLDQDVQVKSMKNELSIKFCQSLPSFIHFLSTNLIEPYLPDVIKISNTYNDYFQFVPELSVPFLYKIYDNKNALITMALASCLRRLGNISEAETIYKDFSNEMIEEDIPKYDLAKFYFDYAILIIRRSYNEADYTNAKILLSKAHNLYLEINRKIGIANTLRRTAELEINYNNIEDAIELLKQAITIYESHEVPLGISNSNYDMGNCYISLNNYEKAAECFKNTFDLYYSISDPNGYCTSAAKILLCKSKLGDVFNFYMDILNKDFNKISDSEAVDTINNILQSLE